MSTSTGPAWSLTTDTYLGQTEIDEDAFPALVVPQKVGGLDIPMDDASFVRIVERTEKASKVFADMRRVDVFVE